MTPEGKVKVKIKKWYADNLVDHWRISPRGGPFGKQGTADDIICYRGFFVAIEVKAPDGSLTPLQINSLQAVAKAGGVAAAVIGFDVIKLQMVKTLIDKKYEAMLRGLNVVPN